MKILSWNVGGEHTFQGGVQDGDTYDEEDREYFKNCIADLALIKN